MKVSIVTISYNQAAFLESAILSVLNQHYPDVEYIVVDPGSTDGSRDIIEAYRSRIDTVVFEPDLGPADGLNRGFARASGHIFGFLNADDVLYDGAISQMVDAFQQYQQVDVISAHGYIMDRSGKIMRKIFSDRYSILCDTYGQTLLVQPSTFFLASAYKKTKGFNVENQSNWDGELFYHIAQSGGRFMTVPGFWSGYRLYSESITGGASMDAEIKAYGRQKFEALKGREWRYYDVVPQYMLKLFKHISHPRALLERVTKGAIYGRG